jgi:hypothetical protein
MAIHVIRRMKREISENNKILVNRMYSSSNVRIRESPMSLHLSGYSLNNWSSIPDRVKNFSLLYNAQSGSGIHNLRHSAILQEKN